MISYAKPKELALAQALRGGTPAGGGMVASRSAPNNSAAVPQPQSLTKEQLAQIAQFGQQIGAENPISGLPNVVHDASAVGNALFGGGGGPPIGAGASDGGLWGKLGRAGSGASGWLSNLTGAF